jgi:hypothetical protein
VVNDPAVLGAHYAQQVATANPIGHGGVITAGDIDVYLARVATSPGWALAQTKIAQFDPSGGGGSVTDNTDTDNPPPLTNADSSPTLPAVDTTSDDDAGSS